MKDTERVIGSLEEFKDWAKKEFDSIRTEIKELNQFRWRIAGQASIISLVVMFLAQALQSILKSK